jgi:orotate phosphoribosyltransferase
MENLEKEIAEQLLKIKAVFLRPQEPFVWASGIKSPIYCDNRLTLSYPEVREVIENGIVEVVRKEYPSCEVLIGTSTAGIPHAAIAAHIMGLPTGYVRSSNKEHGRNNKIEGVPPIGKKVVVVEDLISTGGSSVEVVEALREIGAIVLGIVSIFTYNLKKGVEKLNAAKIKNVSLSNVNALVSAAEKLGYVTENEGNMVLKFINDPLDESWITN